MFKTKDYSLNERWTTIWTAWSSSGSRSVPMTHERKSLVSWHNPTVLIANLPTAILVHHEHIKPSDCACFRGQCWSDRILNERSIHHTNIRKPNVGNLSRLSVAVHTATTRCLTMLEMHYVCWWVARHTQWLQWQQVSAPHCSMESHLHLWPFWIK